jgi:hypothetical protein
MQGEKTIEVNVKDHTDSRSGQVYLDVGRTIAQVRPQILETLVMESAYDSGPETTYAFYNDSDQAKPYLQDSQYVGEVLSPGQTVRVVPQIIAGGLNNECT